MAKKPKMGWVKIADLGEGAILAPEMALGDEDGRHIAEIWKKRAAAYQAALDAERRQRSS